MNLGDKILELRKKSNLSQETLAEKVGVTRQTISKWELGDTYPDIKQASKIAELFEITLDELIGNLIIAKIDATEKENKKGFKIVVCLSSFLILLFIIELVAVSFYFLGTNKVNGEGRILLSCYSKNNNEESIYINYDNNNDIIQMSGSNYIFENIVYKKDYKNSVNLISDILKHYEENNGYCK